MQAKKHLSSLSTHKCLIYFIKFIYWDAWTAI